jgi:hypothetical protein
MRGVTRWIILKGFRSQLTVNCFAQIFQRSAVVHCRSTRPGRQFDVDLRRIFETLPA